MSAGDVFGMVLFVAVLAWLFGPALFDAGNQATKRFRAHKKARGTR